METPFRFKGVHNCEAVVLTCIDFRFWKDITKFVEDELGIKAYDFPSLPGAAKAINECASEKDLALSCIGIPCDLHHVKKTVIINHWDCGAYGGSKSFENREAEESFHINELKKAKDKVLQYYPEQEVILALARLSENGEDIEFVLVDK
jgi:carbonic anhydrase